MLSDSELTFVIEDEVMKITTVEVASESSATRSDQIAENATILASERRIKDALSDEASVNCADTPLGDVVEYLQRQHDIPIILDTISIGEAGLLVDEPINLVLAGVTLRSVLNIMLSDLELTFVIEDEVMKITTVEVVREKSASRVNVTEDRKLGEQSDDASLEGNRETVIPNRPLDDVRTKSGLLPITGATSERTTASLCSIIGVPARNIKLELVGNEFADGKRVTLSKNESSDDALSHWKVIQDSASALERPVEVGQFEFRDERLSFLASDNSESSLLEFCLLRVSTADPPDTEPCRLWKPLHLRDLAMTFEDTGTVYNLISETLPQLSANDLRLTIETAGCGDCVFPAGKELAVGSPVTVEVTNRRGKLFSTRFSLTTQENRPLLVVSHFADVPQVTLRNDTPAIALSEQPLSTATLAALRRSGLKQQREINKLIDSKTRLLSRVTTLIAARVVKEELGTLTDTGSSLDELATHSPRLKKPLKRLRAPAALA